MVIMGTTESPVNEIILVNPLSPNIIINILLSLSYDCVTPSNGGENLIQYQENPSEVIVFNSHNSSGCKNNDTSRRNLISITVMM